MDSDVILTDGALDWSGGINSDCVTTIQSERIPQGLPRNMLAWADNCTMRGGTLMPRPGWIFNCNISADLAPFQGKFMYAPFQANPYFIMQIGGHILRVDVETGSVIDLTELFPANVPQFNPVTSEKAFFVQAEQFLVIQAGDGVTLPFIWDGATLRRSIGINNPAVAPGTPGVNEIPAATAMDYFMGRLWYAQDRQVSAGDIVNGPSGTVIYENKDSVLNVTENPLVLNGDGFTIPTNDGTVIRGIKHSANIDAALGQGRLFVGTRKAIYALNVPVTRTDWIAANNNNQPLMTVVQLANGWVNDTSVVAVNGDLFYQSLEPGIRSLNQSTRFFGQWANTQISANEDRILQYNDRALLRFSSGVYFDDRMLQTALPVQTSKGVVHNALIPLDFNPISTFKSTQNPNWEGMQEGLKIFQVAEGDFGGRERAFATILAADNSIKLWEISNFAKFDHNSADENRIVWIMEFPAFTWGDETSLKKLVSGELWIDRLAGVVDFIMEYRPDGQACWLPWHAWQKCSAKNSEETVANPAAYPLIPCPESYFATMTLPLPPLTCATATNRPSNQAYQFQPRLIIKGFCRLRALYLHATKMQRQLYSQITC